MGQAMTVRVVEEKPGLPGPPLPPSNPFDVVVGCVVRNASHGLILTHTIGHGVLIWAKSGGVGLLEYPATSSGLAPYIFS